MIDFASVIADKLERLRAAMRSGLDIWPPPDEAALLEMARYAAETELIRRYPLLYHKHETPQ